MMKRTALGLLRGPAGFATLAGGTTCAALSKQIGIKITFEIKNFLDIDNFKKKIQIEPWEPCLRELTEM